MIDQLTMKQVWDFLRSHKCPDEINIACGQT